MSATVFPASLQGTPQALTITWNDGIVHTLTWERLRSSCPCAHCKAKRAEPKPLFAVLKPEEAAPVKATRMDPLGNYAYHIDFSDGHHSGIFSFELLRELGEGKST
jgi:DUF971 family protein